MYRISFDITTYNAMADKSELPKQHSVPSALRSNLPSLCDTWLQRIFKVSRLYATEFKLVRVRKKLAEIKFEPFILKNF